MPALPGTDGVFDFCGLRTIHAIIVFDTDPFVAAGGRYTFPLSDPLHKKSSWLFVFYVIKIGCF
jgi:hypothetical protein